MTLERGSLLNKRYRIVEILGQGGMAAVYKAVDENLGVEVAVKENLFTTEEYARQFHREAVILANLRHPNLPRVTDHFVIEQRGQYLVMDYIEGEDLRQRMDRMGPLPEQDVIVVGIALCDALIYMHSCNPPVLHRDLKPGNVKITPQGQIFLVDFGLAKVVMGRQATTTGARAMTPGYSPPEQYGTARTDHRSDIYSLGATLYSALTDIIPEDGLARAMDQAVLTPLTKHNPKISRRLASVIEKAMAVRPDDRYQSAQDLRRDLLNARTTTRRKMPVDLKLSPPPSVLGGSEISDEAIIEGEEAVQEELKKDDLVSYPISTPEIEAATPVKFRGVKRRKSFTWLYLMLLFLLLGTSIWTYLIDPTFASRVNTWIKPVGVVAVVDTPTETPTSTLEPTQKLEFTATNTFPPTETFTSLPPVITTSTPSPRPSFTLTPKITFTPAWTPTETPLGGGANQIAFASDRSGVPEIYLMNIDGSNLRQVTDLPEGACQPNWHPDGSRLLFISPCPKNQERYPGSSIFVIHADGSGLAPILPNVPGGDFNPSWSPDGKWVAFNSLRGGDAPIIYLYDIEKGTLKGLGDNPPKQDLTPEWSPSGDQLVYSSGTAQIKVMQKDGSNRFLLARNVGSDRADEPTWSPSGMVVVFTGWSSDLSVPWLMAVQFSLEGAPAVKIPGSDYSIEADFSPDGFWLVFTSFPNGNRDIYIMTSNGVGKQQLTNDPAVDFDPDWRPPVQTP